MLDSPDVKTSKDVELMNLANSTNNNYEFIPYGTNLRSIWSARAVDVDAENAYNMSLASDMLGEKFGPISIGGRSWLDNERNCAIEEMVDDLQNIWNAKKVEKWSEPESLNPIALSLLKLNHSKETSSFTEVIPKSIPPATRLPKIQVFSKKTNESSEKEKEDLLTSSSSHFKPIVEKTSKPKGAHYEDGTTFVIPNNLDVVNYTRSESGMMCVETDWGAVKKYLEYKDEKKQENAEFVLKFNVCQNDKGCQTDSEEEIVLDEKDEEEIKM